MAKSKSQADNKPSQNETVEPRPFRERLEIMLFIAVEVLCLLLFIDFLFFGFYVK